MLTAYQCETIAYMTDSELLCPDCAYDANAGLADGVSRYGLDEYQTASAYDDEWCVTGGYYEDLTDWECNGCARAVTCEQCGTELVEEYDAGDCGVPDES
jgi:hypothetical protein